MTEVTCARAYPPTPARVAALDGLRALAIGLVVGYHAQVPGLHGGAIGVDIFFTLSGFLITGVLLRPADLSWAELKRFYMRRVLRLFPALIVVVAFCLLYSLLWLDDGARSFVFTESATSLSYTTDFYLSFVQRPGDPWGLLGHTWTLGVEEQFYLIWPFALILIMRRATVRAKLTLVFLAAVADSVWRAGLNISGQHAYIGSAFDTHLDVLLVGCALALALPDVVDRLEQRHQRSMTCGALASICLIAMISAVPPHLRVFPLDTGYLVVAIATAAIIVRLIVPCSTRVARSYVAVFSFSPVVWIGAISYGIYLWHVVVFDIFKRAFDIDTQQRRVVFAPLLLLATIAVAALSYYVVEKPFLRLKDERFRARFGGIRRGGPAPSRRA
ncbi:MAG: acyltransferase [Actinomycetota bacterium]|nr:acyltransferase [Actinomycetota bacterium]